MTRTYASFPAIYSLVKEIPAGQVASYGMVASLLPGVTPRIVGFAMAATPAGEGIPWQRVINSAGKISKRDGAARQRSRLESEGVTFLTSGKVDWRAHRWQGPGEAWLDENDIDFMDFLTTQSSWPG
ncbi:MGMT family protein [Kordiimonas aestuarii]|uniref:MGMT family protein n=1 Tax=Kordiimonas aestuarii TaxID=1005925 RepID=UPI0021CEBDD3|nr:MGMT family protein [Kordiimonas aestuarii]